MAVYLEIYKVADSPEKARFVYDGKNGAQVTLELDKQSGNIEVVSGHTTDAEERRTALARRKVELAWDAGDPLPTKLVWAS